MAFWHLDKTPIALWGIGPLYKTHVDSYAECQSLILKPANLFLVTVSTNWLNKYIKFTEL